MCRYGTIIRIKYMLLCCCINFSSCFSILTFIRYVRCRYFSFLSKQYLSCSDFSSNSKKLHSMWFENLIFFLFEKSEAPKDEKFYFQMKVNLHKSLNDFLFLINQQILVEFISEFVCQKKEPAGRRGRGEPAQKGPSIQNFSLIKIITVGSGDVFFSRTEILTKNEILSFQ